jgi:hypothetical protein
MTVLNITLEEDGYYYVNGNRQVPSVSLYMPAGATKLRRMLRETDDLIVCPGVYDGLSARVAMSLGFKALYMVGTRSPPHTCLTEYTNELDRLAREQPPRDLVSRISGWLSSTT